MRQRHRLLQQAFGPVGRHCPYFRGPSHLRVCTTRPPVDQACCRLLQLVGTHRFRCCADQDGFASRKPI